MNSKTAVDTAAAQPTSMSRSDALNLLVEHTPYGTEDADQTSCAVSAIVAAFECGRAATPVAQPSAEPRALTDEVLHELFRKHVVQVGHTNTIRALWLDYGRAVEDALRAGAGEQPSETPPGFTEFSPLEFIKTDAQLRAYVEQSIADAATPVTAVGGEPRLPGEGFDAWWESLPTEIKLFAPSNLAFHTWKAARSIPGEPK